MSVPSGPAASTIEDVRLSDSVFRTMMWLLSLDNNAVVNLEDHGKRRRIGLGKILEHLKELESLGMIKSKHDGGESTIEVGGGVSEREKLVADLTKKHAADAEAATKKREERQKHRPKPVRHEEPQSRVISAHTLRTRWREEWIRKWPNTVCPQWIAKDMGIAKKLIEILGPEDALRAVELVIDQWDSISVRQRMNGHPSLERVMYLRATELPGLLSGKRIGKTRTPEAARKRSLEGSEYDAARTQNSPTSGWGDDDS